MGRLLINEFAELATIYLGAGAALKGRSSLGYTSICCVLGYERRERASRPQFSRKFSTRHRNFDHEFDQISRESIPTVMLA
jgi:hypothetical protein